jgi:hypothetical protein
VEPSKNPELAVGAQDRRERHQRHRGQAQDERDRRVDVDVPCAIEVGGGFIEAGEE